MIGINIVNNPKEFLMAYETLEGMSVWFKTCTPSINRYFFLR